MLKSKIGLFAIPLVISILLYGCSSNDTSNASEEQDQGSTLKIFTTIFPIHDFTEKIGGVHVDVENVYPPNADAHSYEPTTKTMTKIADASALIYNGAGIEGFVDASIEVLKNENVTFVKASEGIDMISDNHDEEEVTHEVGHHTHDEEATHEDEHHSQDEEATHEDGHHSQDEEATHEDGHHDHGDIDPHVWLDPNHAITIAENIKNALIELKPEAKEEFEENFFSLKNELEKLDNEFEEMVQHASNKEILVAHEAYGYWEKRYGIEQIAISGQSPTQHPSQKQLTQIIDLANEHELNYVLLEKNTPTKISNVVSNEIEADELYLSNLESITEEDILNKEDYFSIMRRNIDTLRTALN